MESLTQSDEARDKRYRDYSDAMSNLERELYSAIDEAERAKKQAHERFKASKDALFEEYKDIFGIFPVSADRVKEEV